MKPNRRFTLTLLAALLCAGTSVFAEPSQTDLVKQARLTRSQAEQIALKQAPRGKVKSAEIENEKGHLVWSFDIARAGKRDITEILVDARSGEIVSKATETPRQQADEAAGDQPSARK